MIGQYEELSFSFFDEGRIVAIHVPGAVSFKRFVAKSFPRKKVLLQVRDPRLIKSGCPVCDETRKEAKSRLGESLHDNDLYRTRDALERVSAWICSSLTD